MLLVQTFQKSPDFIILLFGVISSMYSKVQKYSPGRLKFKITTNNMFFYNQQKEEPAT